MSIASITDSSSHSIFKNERAFAYSNEQNARFKDLMKRLENAYKTTFPAFTERLLTDFTSNPSHWHILEEYQLQRDLYKPKKEFLIAKTDYYRSKYDININVVSITDLEETLCSLSDEELSYPYLGFIVLTNEDNHAVPLLINMKALDKERIKCHECVLMNAGDNSSETQYDIYQVLENFGVEEEDVIRAKQEERQADGFSCMTGALVLLRNALLDIKHRSITSLAGHYKITKEEDEVTGDDATFLELPPTWTWGEQIFHYRPEELEATNPRDYFSKNPEKKAHPRTIAKMREAYRRAVGITSSLRSSLDKTGVFDGCAVPDGFTPEAPEIRIGLERTYTMYLQLKGLKDCEKGDIYFPKGLLEPDRKRTRIE